jgi:hypothetical protein
MIEGCYYLEFKMLSTSSPETPRPLNSPPSVRLGICPADYPTNSPLGQGASLAFKMSNGALVYAGAEHPGGPLLSPGDVVGLAMRFSPPHKTQDSTALWEDCELLLTRNGTAVARTNQIKQVFYCPAVSLFNYASV